MLFCGTGWFPIIDAIQTRLGKETGIEASIEVWDRQIPLVEAVRGARVLFPSNAQIPGDAIRAARDLILIQQPAVGVDRVDLDAAHECGIPVCNAPSANHMSVADAAMLLILALARRFPELNQSFRDRVVGGPCGVELAGKTLGIVGMGRSGQALAMRAPGFEMHVISITSRSSRAELQALLARSDFVSLHLPLTDATTGLIDADALATMKTGAFLINCARGAIVDRAALEAALEAGRLGGFGVDAHWREPWDPDDPLYARLDVVALPHIAGSTAESFARIAAIVAENIRRVVAGEPPLHRVA
jgi:phosphoglycerate dehydrogenase-like enzyme